MARNQVVPVLESGGESVDRCGRELRIKREVGNLQMVRREVACCEVLCAVSLIVQAVIGLRAVADVGVVPVVDSPVEAAVVAPLVEGTRNRFRAG